VRLFRQSAMKKFGSEFFTYNKNFGAPVKPKSRRTLGMKIFSKIHYILKDLDAIFFLELPSFWEFVQFLKTSLNERPDEHWAPQVEFCNLCDTSYNFILKYENFLTEIPFLWQNLGVQNLISPDRWTQPEHSFEENVNLTKIYFSMLDPSDIQFLSNYYSLDFQVLNYKNEYKV